MVYGLNFLERDGEKIILLFMLPLAQNHGKMYTRCKIVVIELECEFSNFSDELFVLFLYNTMYLRIQV